jgi:hypothetical protein
MDSMDPANNGVGAWLRCYRCWSRNLEVQLHVEGIYKIDPDSGDRADTVDELHEAVIQCVDCLHDQPHLAMVDGRIQPVADRWERMVMGTPWVASVSVSVPEESVEACAGPEAAESLTHASLGEAGVREFFTHVRFHKHEDGRIISHMLVEFYARSADEATDVLETAARGLLTISSLAEESRPPAAAGEDAH